MHVKYLHASPHVRHAIPTSTEKISTKNIKYGDFMTIMVSVMKFQIITYQHVVQCMNHTSQRQERRREMANYVKDAILLSKLETKSGTVAMDILVLLLFLHAISFVLLAL